MYAVAAQIQDARVISVPLIRERGFALDPAAVLGHWGPKVKLVFLCSPNNPTGNLLEEKSILEIADSLAGRALVVVDEAYIEFSSRASLVPQVARRPYLAVLRTLSKAHGLAGARLGTLIANPEVIVLLRKLITPYAIPQLTLEAALTLLSAAHLRTLPRRVREIRTERDALAQALAKLPGVTAVWPSEANFLLVRFADPASAIERARDARLLVRDVRGNWGLEDALRITVGTPAENLRLLVAWA
jgi:histidinol-phosphate aminotransferase